MFTKKSANQQTGSPYFSALQGGVDLKETSEAGCRSVVHRCALFRRARETERQGGNMAGMAVRRGGGVWMKLAAMMTSCVLLFLVAGCGVDGKASGEAHPHQGKVKVLCIVGRESGIELGVCVFKPGKKPCL